MNVELDFLKFIAARLDSANIPYMLTGSLAMTLYAIPRMTRDIDLVVDLNPTNAAETMNLFSKECYIDADSVHDAVVRRSMFNIIHYEFGVKADFIVRKDEDYRRVELERRRRVSVDELDICVVAPEDLALSKLVWAKQSESEFQLRDVRAILEFVAPMNWDYLHKWAETLGVTHLLEKAEPHE